jgi:hypothetical protein
MALETDYQLPLAITGEGDAMRVRRELAALDDYINQAALRKPGTPLKHLPKASPSLSEFSELNRLNLLDQSDRSKMLDFFSELVERGPRVHISFASEPSSLFMSKITAWFRSSVHPLVLITVGLEPSVAAGCTVRTDNHFHDFSLRQHFIDQRGLLLSGIKEPSALSE